MLRSTVTLAICATAILALACYRPPPPPDPPTWYALSAPVISGDVTVFTAAVRTCPRCDDIPYVVRCTEGGECDWQRASPARERREVHGRSAAAIEIAGAQHDCQSDQISVQSDATRDGVEGYWLLVCGTQRFYQWDAAQSRFVDRTPSP